MNNYSLETNRTTSPQAVGKAAQSTQASQAAQAFSDFLGGAKTTAKTTVASPVLKHDTTAFNQLFNKPTWHLDQDVSSSRPGRKTDEISETSRDRKALTDDQDAKSASPNNDTETVPEKQTEQSTGNQPEDRPRHEKSAQQNESETETPDADAVVIDAAKASVPDTAANLTRTSTLQTATVPGTALPSAQAGQQAASAAAADQGKSTGSGKGNTASVQVTQAAVTSQPTSNLTAAASVSAINTADDTVATVASAVSATAQNKGQGISSGTAETTGVKSAVQGTSPQAVMASASGQGANNNTQSQNGNNLARAELGAATAAKPTAVTTSTGFAQSLGNATSTAGSSSVATELKPQKPLNVTASDQLSISIKKAVGENKDSISIKLHPSELGRVDVKLEIADNGVMKAMISAERPDTLDLLQRDSRLLEKALQEAGLKTDGQSLSFNLKQNGDQNGASGDRSAFAAKQGDNQSSDTELAENELSQQGPLVSRHDGDLDISI